MVNKSIVKLLFHATIAPHSPALNEGNRDENVLEREEKKKEKE